MKKFITILIMFLCIVGLTACQGGGCGKEPEPEPTPTPAGNTDLAAAKSYLKTLYDNAAVATPSDFQVVANVKGGETTFNVEWSVDAEEAYVKVVPAADGAALVTIDVNEESDKDVNYTLKAKITTSDGEVLELTWSHTLPKFAVSTWEEYVAIENGKALSVEGIITAIIGKKQGNSYNCLYVQDESGKGAYYAYGMAADPSDPEAGLSIGMKVRLTGEKDVYSGTHELKNATWKVLDETIHTITPVDYTEKYTNAENLKDANLVAAQGLLVTIKGVEITQVGGSDNSYYQFKLAGKESYVRISSSVCPLTKADQTEFINGYKAHENWLADVTGVINVYDGAFYLSPVSKDAFDYKSLPVKTDAEAVAIVKAGLALPQVKFEDPTEVALTVKGYGEQVSISYASNNEQVTFDATTGKLVVTLGEEDVEVTITATLTAGEATDTKEFTITVSAEAADEYLPIISEAKAGTFKLVLDLTGVDAGYLYATGTIDSKGALETTNKAAKAADFVIAAVEGKENTYTIKVGDKYLVAYRNGTYNNMKLDETAGEWVWDADAKVLKATISYQDNGTDKTVVVYFGTYLKNNVPGNTMALSALSYITGDNASKVGVSQFPASLATLVPALAVPEAAEAVAGTHKLVLDLTGVGAGYLYATGAIDSKGALETTNKYSKAADFVIAAVEGKTNTYTIKVGDKYLVAYRNGTYNNMKLDETAGEWEWDADAKVLKATIAYQDNGTDKTVVVYFGTYLKNNVPGNTMALSALTYITGDNASKVGVSQFPAVVADVKLYEAELEAAEAVAGTHKLVLDLTGVGAGYLYATGTIDSKGALETTNKYSKAADFVIAAVEGKENTYTIKVGDKYLVAYRNGTYNNMKLDETAGEWQWDADAKVLKATIAYQDNGTDKTVVVYFGTYLKNNVPGNTMALSALTYITGDNASKVGVSQFPAVVGELVAKKGVVKEDVDLLATEPNKVNSHEVTKSLVFAKNGNDEWGWVGLNVTDDLTGYNKVVATVYGTSGEQILFKTNDTVEKWVTLVGVLQDVEFTLPAEFTWDAAKKTMILFANPGKAGTGHNFIITKLELQGEGKEAINLLAGELIKGAAYEANMEFTVAKPSTVTNEWDSVWLKVENDLTGYKAVKYVVQGRAGDQLLLKVNDQLEKWVTLTGKVQEGIVDISSLEVKNDKLSMVLFANPGKAGNGVPVIIYDLEYLVNKPAEVQPVKENANVNPLADLPGSDADYVSPVWKAQKYTNNGWEAISAVTMRSRAKDNVRVTNMVGGYSTSYMYTYSQNDASLGLANHFEFVAGNYFSNATDMKIKVKLVDMAGNDHFLLGSSGNDGWYTFHVTTGLEKFSFDFDEIEVKRIVFVNNSTVGASVYFYAGQMSLRHVDYANVNLLADLPTSDADYTSANWKTQKYADNAWVDVTTVSMRSRAKDGVRVTNMAGGYSTAYTYTYSKGTSLGYANGLTFKAGNYYTGAQDMKIKVKVVDTAGNDHFLLGSSGNDGWYTFHVTTGLEEFDLPFDGIEVAKVVFVINSPINGSAFFYAGDMILGFAAPSPEA